MVRNCDNLAIIYLAKLGVRNNNVLRLGTFAGIWIYNAVKVFPFITICGRTSKRRGTLRVGIPPNWRSKSLLELVSKSKNL